MTAALAGFKSGSYKVLVATDIAARGIDVEALGSVVNFDVSHQPEDYIHRVGRTARAQLTGDAYTLLAPEEERDFGAIERALGKRLPRHHAEGFDYASKPAAEGRFSGMQTAGPARVDQTGFGQGSSKQASAADRQAADRRTNGDQQRDLTRVRLPGGELARLEVSYFPRAQPRRAGARRGAGSRAESEILLQDVHRKQRRVVVELPPRGTFPG